MYAFLAFFLLALLVLLWDEFADELHAIPRRSIMAGLLNWLSLPCQIALGIALAGVAARVLHALGLG